MINQTILLKQINEKFYKHFAYINVLKYIINVDTYIINNKKTKQKQSYIYGKCIYSSLFT